MDKIAEFGCVQITIPVCMQARWHDGKMEGMMAMYGTLRGFLCWLTGHINHSIFWKNLCPPEVSTAASCARSLTPCPAFVVPLGSTG